MDKESINEEDFMKMGVVKNLNKAREELGGGSSRATVEKNFPLNGINNHTSGLEPNMTTHVDEPLSKGLRMKDASPRTSEPRNNHLENHAIEDNVVGPLFSAMAHIGI